MNLEEFYTELSQTAEDKNSKAYIKNGYIRIEVLGLTEEEEVLKL